MDDLSPHHIRTTMNDLRTRLRELYQQKEKVFGAKRRIQEKTGTLLSQVRQLKSERDALTAEVKTFKSQREQAHQLRKEKTHEQSSVQQQQKELFQAVRSSERPEALQRRIARWEEQLETEVMPFSREQTLRKGLKELKLQYQEARQRVEQWKSVVHQSQELSGITLQAESLHRLIQEKAAASQRKHEELLTILKEVTALRGEKKQRDEEYSQLRTAYNDVQKQLKETVGLFKGMTDKLKEEDHQAVRSLLEEKSVLLEEKLKKRKKLTTEDVLVFQALARE